MTHLTHDSRDVMQRRIDMGVACLRIVDPSMSLDNETAAKDAISNILTAVVGPPGCFRTEPHELDYNPQAGHAARGLLEDAYVSWEGDAEDYCAIDPPPSSGLEIIKSMYEKRAKEYRETVEPGVTDNSPLEAQLEVLHDVICILEDAEKGGS